MYTGIDFESESDLLRKHKCAEPVRAFIKFCDQMSRYGYTECYNEIVYTYVVELAPEEE